MYTYYIKWIETCDPIKTKWRYEYEPI